MVRPRKTSGTDFGNKLAHARRSAGMTQIQFAKKLGISQQKVDYYERRAKNPTLSFLKKAAKALGITVGELIGETPAKKKSK